jgi:hypothetical protein
VLDLGADLGHAGGMVIVHEVLSHISILVNVFS